MGRHKADTRPTIDVPIKVDVSLIMGSESEVVRKYDDDDVKDPVKTPVVIKVSTATKDRGLHRAKPHIPCPLVHPFDNFVPRPTKNPAKV